MPDPQPGHEDHRMTPVTGTFRDVVARLHTAQKPRAQTPLYLRVVNRRLGGYVAAAGYVRGATPDQLTALSALLSLAGLAVVAALPQSWPAGVGAALLLLAGYAVDSADGQLARLRGGGSPAGEWLDHGVDAVLTCLLHTAVLVAIVRTVPAPPLWLLVLPMVFLTASVAIAFGSMLRDQLLRGERSRGRSAPAEGADSMLRSVLLLPVDHGTLCVAFVLLGWWSGFLVVYGALAVLHVLFGARLLVRCRRALAGDPVRPAPVREVS